MTFDDGPAARAARNVPGNPRPLCRDFRPKPAPAAFWCVTCGWSEPMHADETRRAAIAAEPERLARDVSGPTSDQPPRKATP